MSRTQKRPYTKSRRFDPSCRNHGSCGYCTSNRTVQAQREAERIASLLADAEQDESSPATGVCL